jgi:hypothetical protein
MSSPSTSFVGWIDYSEKERASMMNALGLFSQGTVDELGIGTVRDALADILFPGTSTIQTRVRYFLIVAWIYERIEGRMKKGRSAADYARYVEAQVTESLRRSPEAKGKGVIGAGVGALLLRPASDIYWRGMRKWGIRLFDGSRDQYHGWLDLQQQRKLAPSDVVETEDEEAEIGTTGRWHPGLPRPPAAFPEIVSLELQESEARYLRERILTNAPKSYLAFLVRQPLSVAGHELPWSGADQWSTSPDLKRNLEVARKFSELIYGASLTYNLMLARACNSERWVPEYQGGLQEWSALIEAAAPEYIDWDSNALWDVVEGLSGRTHPSTKAFVETWKGFVVDCLRRRESPSGLADKPAVQSLIQRREANLKRGRARLGNPEKLASWGGNSGASQLDYRWAVVKSQVADIQAGSFNGA